MIRFENDMFYLKGNEIDILTEFSCIVESLLKCGIEKDKLDYAYSLPFMSEKECIMKSLKILNREK